MDLDENCYMQTNVAFVSVKVCVIGWRGNPHPITSWYTNLRVSAVTFTNAGKTTISGQTRLEKKKKEPELIVSFLAEIFYRIDLLSMTW